MRWEQLDRQSVDKLVARIHRSGQRATAMIRDLLDFTQARLGGGIPVGRRPADLRAIVGQVVEELEVAHPERSFDVQHLGNTEGEWDPGRLSQVAGNLLSNAVAYSPTGSVIHIRTEDLGEREVALVIRNDGVPINADLLPHLFEPMRRASAELNNTSRSVGLGLYIVKHIVEAHGGEVGVRSAAGEGTTLRVELPRR